MPPMPKQKMRLSMSNPVVCARSNRLGGFQYSGTKSGSVRPNGVVNRLAHHIVLRCCGNAAYAASHGARNALDQTSQTYCSGSRSEEHTSELQSLMRISYAVFCLKKKTKTCR